MKHFLIIIAIIPFLSIAQQNVIKNKSASDKIEYIKSIDNLTLDAAFIISNQARDKSFALDKKVSIAILDASGNTILLIRDDNVGVHNTEAARRKAYTALSTKTSTFDLLQNANNNPLTKNLNTLPELLLLSGGLPIWFHGNVIGSIGIAGGGSPENDDLIAKSAAIIAQGITTSKQLKI